MSEASAVSASTPASARPRGVAEPGKLVFSDEFDGKRLNEAKWNARDQERTQSKRKDGLRWWYKPENVSVGDGKLSLGISKLGHNQYGGARVDTWRKFEFTYGTVEFRMHIPPAQGHLAAAWMQSAVKESQTGTGADGTEIDLIETPYPTDRFATSIHYDGYGPDHKTASTRTTKPGLRTGYHTLALHWTPKKLTFLYDGEEIWTVTDPALISRVKEFPIASNEILQWAKGDIREAPLDASSAVLVDYIRVWQ
ncbi:glycoside hydrolase family 16 protein [Streptomyces sp. NPDC051907]|uniref:glycoside hydrolase family 16 protein n=1 Tax=Streptomyces sp. NPDC051907 TaxID=3155284 RepID=UPI00343A2EF6